MNPFNCLRPNGCSRKIATGFCITREDGFEYVVPGFRHWRAESVRSMGRQSAFSRLLWHEAPEGCSRVILNQLWESVCGDGDPTLIRHLDCQFQLAQAIHVSLKGFHQLTTGEMIRRL